jgi:hypothetical protein
MLLRNFIAACSGVSTGRNHQAKLQYELKIVM